MLVDKRWIHSQRQLCSCRVVKYIWMDCCDCAMWTVDASSLSIIVCFCFADRPNRICAAVAASSIGYAPLWPPRTQAMAHTLGYIIARHDQRDWVHVFFMNLHTIKMMFEECIEWEKIIYHDTVSAKIDFKKNTQICATICAITMISYWYVPGMFFDDKRVIGDPQSNTNDNAFATQLLAILQQFEAQRNTATPFVTLHIA